MAQSTTDCVVVVGEGNGGAVVSTGTDQPMKASLAPCPDNQLMIEKVVLENFKSYGGRHVLGPFHYRFSSIVGPNGSGKSNIIDAMLFVFGRRAQQLRHKKLAGLIHHSPAFPNQSSTRVEVHFQNVVHKVGSQYGERVPGTEFVIAREAYTDGTSQYMLNGRLTTQKDVIALLRSRGVDLDHNRFLILQGEVEQIAMMKPKGQSPNEEGLLEYLEDIIGSNRYISEIEVAQERLKQIVESLSSKREAMNAVQTQVASMEGPLQMAKGLCEAERKVLILKAQLEQKTALSIERHRQRTQKSFDTAKAEYDAWSRSRENSKKEITNLEEMIKKQEDIILKAERMLNTTETEFAALERLDNELAAKQAHCMKRAQALEKECTKLEEEKLSCGTDIDQLTEKMKQLEDEIPKERSAVAALEGRLEALDKELEGEFDVLRKRKEHIDKLLEPETMKYGDLVATLGVSQAQVNLIEEHRSTSLERLKSMEQKATSSKEHLRLKERELKETDATLEKLKAQYFKKREEVSRFRDTLIAQKDELQSLRSQAELKETSLLRARSETMLVPAILAAKQDGRLHGVIDRLWNLGSVDTKFEPAVAAVAGSEYILVENTKDAERVVAFVRQHNLGRVTCIVMSHIRRELHHDLQNLRSSKVLPSSAQLLLDQIRPVDPQYEIAFYFVLRDVLVVPTLDVARQVAFGGTTRWRVVTLEGHVIDKSGAMSGGGGGRKLDEKLSIFRSQFAASSAMKLTETSMSSQQEIEQLRIKIRDVKGSLTITQDTKAKAEQELTQIEEQMNATRGLRLRLSSEKEAAQEDVAHYSQAVTECAIPELSAKEQKRLDRLLEEMMVHQEQMEGQKRVVEKHQEMANKIKKEIEMIGGGKRQRAREALLSTKKGLEDLQNELLQTEVQLGLRRKRILALEKLLPQKTGDIQRERETAKGYTQERNALTDKAELVLRKKEELEKILNEQKDIGREHRASLKSLVDKAKKSGLQEVSFQTRLQDLEQTLTTVKHNLQKHQKQLRRIQEDWNAIPGFDEDDVVESKISINDAPSLQSQGNTVNVKCEPKLCLQMDLAEDVLDKLDEVVVSCEIKNLTESALTVKVDLSIIEKYKAASRVLKQRVGELEACCLDRDATTRELDSLELMRLREFTSGFLRIASKVKEMYQMITHEGDAELELADPSSPFTGGVVFSVRPPKKSWKRIQNLSGGEKTLSSLALVFALHHFRPTPIYFLDEIDAALDHRNVSTIGLYIASQAKNAQFIIVSLRNHMFEMADRLLGIYKVTGSTRTTFIDPDDFVEDEDEKGTLALLDREADKLQATTRASTLETVSFRGLPSLAC